MNSRLLTNLDATIGQPSSDSELFLAMARKAAHLGKLGLNVEARSLVMEVRANPLAMRFAPVVSVLNFAEGLVEYKQGRVNAGKDKWTRARAIAASVEFKEGVSTASAWLAFAAYLSECLEDMDRNLRAALDAGCVEHAQAMSRTALVMALGLHYCSGPDHAAHYYDLCHRAATKCGDETELSALMHDRSAMIIHEMRVASLHSSSGNVKAPSGRTNLQSVVSYEDLVGIRSLPSLSPQLTAYENVLNGRWAAAVEAIDQTLDAARSDGFSRLVPALLAERALAKIMMNRVADAEADLLACITEAGVVEMHRDDQAICYSRLAQIHKLLGKEAEAGRYSVVAQSAWERVREFKLRLLGVILAIDTEYSLSKGGAAMSCR